MSPIGVDTLWPPAVSTYVPAFLRSTTCKLYFSITRQNIIDEIKHVQLSLKNIDTNISALDKVQYPNEIKLCPVYFDNTIATDYCYYIQIFPTDLAEGVFGLQKYYKAQIRFSGVNPDNITSVVNGMPIFSSGPDASWLANNIDYFSEWSTVCLVKGIPEPYVSIQGLKEKGTQMVVGLYDDLGLEALHYDSYDTSPALGLQSLTATAFDHQVLMAAANDLILFTGEDTGYGSMVFSGQYRNSDTSEVLDSYDATLYTQSNGGDAQVLAKVINQTPDTTYQDSAQYSTDGSSLSLDDGERLIHNSFHFAFDAILEDNTPYHLSLTYLTKSGFQETKDYYFTTALSGVYIPYLTIEPVLDEEEGRLGISVISQEYSGQVVKVTGTLQVKRSDHRSNFTLWETIYEEDVNDSVVRETIFDRSAESGVLYKYAINNKGEDSDPVLALYEDIFLIGEDRQLKIRFDPHVSSFKYIVQDSKTETLGGKYPFVTRNGNVKYREMSIGGLITAQSDESNLFTDETELFGAYVQNFADYNLQNGIASQVDFIKEREFRNKVMDFLYDGKVKLYKSTTEGNALVKVTDVSLTPVEGLGRMIYSFSATLTEVADFTLDNCNKNNINICSTETDLIYMIAATFVGEEDGFDNITPIEWSDPVTVFDTIPDVPVVNKDVVYIYQRGLVTPSLPEDTSIYDFDSKVTSNLSNGWTSYIPNADGGILYFTSAKVLSRTSTALIPSTSWSTPVPLPMNIATLCLYKVGSKDGMIKPTTDLDYEFGLRNNMTVTMYEAWGSALSATNYDGYHYDNINTVETENNLSAVEFDRGLLVSAFNPVVFSTNGTLTGNLNGWSLSVPNGSPIQAITTVAFSNESDVIIPASAWSDITTVTAGTDGFNEFAKNSLVYLYQESDTGQPLIPTNATYTFPNTFGNIGNWTPTPPTFNHKPLYFIAAFVSGSASTSSVNIASWTVPTITGYLRSAYKGVIHLFAKQSGRGIPDVPMSDFTYNARSAQLIGNLGKWSVTNLYSE